MKKVTIYIFSLLLLAACDSQQSEQQLITIKAEGRVLVAPNMATLVVHIQCIDRDIEQSTDCLIEKADEVAELARELGIEDNHIQNNGIYQDKEYQWERNTQIFKGYRSSMQTTLTVHDLKILNKLYPSLLKDKNITTTQLQYSRSDQDSLMSIAQTRALKNAENMADNLMNSMGVNEKKLVSIGNVESAVTALQGYSSSNELREQAMVNAESANRMRINSGQIEISEYLYVTYKIN